MSTQEDTMFGALMSAVEAHPATSGMSMRMKSSLTIALTEHAMEVIDDAAESKVLSERGKAAANARWKGDTTKVANALTPPEDSSMQNAVPPAVVRTRRPRGQKGDAATGIVSVPTPPGAAPVDAVVAAAPAGPQPGDPLPPIPSMPSPSSNAPAPTGNPFGVVAPVNSR